jgi:hypothetical protein
MIMPRPRGPGVNGGKEVVLIQQELEKDRGQADIERSLNKERRDTSARAMITNPRYLASCMRAEKPMSITPD